MVQLLKVCQGDSLYSIQFTVKDHDNVVVDLTDVTQIKLKVALPGAALIYLDGACVKVTPFTNGICTYTVQVGELDDVGRYHAELELTYSGGKILTTERFDLEVEKDLP